MAIDPAAIGRLVEDIGDELVEWRRRLHQNPELSSRRWDLSVRLRDAGVLWCWLGALQAHRDERACTARGRKAGPHNRHKSGYGRVARARGDGVTVRLGE